MKYIDTSRTPWWTSSGFHCPQYPGGFAFAVEYDVERKFTKTRLYQVAPVPTNLILPYVAEHVLGLSRSS